jgi:hypothetical protein
LAFPARQRRRKASAATESLPAPLATARYRRFAISGSWCWRRRHGDGRSDVSDSLCVARLRGPSRDKLRASKISRDKAFRNEKIEFLWNTELAEILGITKHGVTGCRLRDTNSGAKRISIAKASSSPLVTSRTPELFKGQIDMDAVAI